MTELRVILIGGPSNAGKSTLAQALADRLGWRVTSTDNMGRHPGRPWGIVKPHVAEHYLTLAPDELFADVTRHYQSMWTTIRNVIKAHVTDDPADRLVLEGSALIPASVVTLDSEGVGAIWLTASNDFLRQRIERVSGFEQLGERERTLISKFVARMQQYNDRMMEDLHRYGLPWLDIGATPSVDDLADIALRRLSMSPFHRRSHTEDTP